MTTFRAGGSHRGAAVASSMPPAVLYLKNRFATADRRFAVGLFAAFQLAALGLLIWLEAEPAAQTAFVLAWGALNFFWLALLRRPLTPAAPFPAAVGGPGIPSAAKP